MTDRTKNTKRFWPIFGKAILVFLIVLAVLGFFYRKELGRLYNVITLFEPNVIVDNFRNMDTMFDYRTVHRGEAVLELKEGKRALPETYVYEGKVQNTAEFIDETWTTGLIVLKGDTVAFEEYYRGNDRDSKAISWSVAKSFVSALIGIAVEEGYIKDIEDPVTAYVPQLTGTGYDNVAIKDVLEMSSGVRFDETYADFFSDINRMGRVIALNKSLDSFVASLENEREPGTFNHYVSMDTQVLGMVLQGGHGQGHLVLPRRKDLAKDGDGVGRVLAHRRRRDGTGLRGAQCYPERLCPIRPSLSQRGKDDGSADSPGRLGPGIRQPQ